MINLLLSFPRSGNTWVRYVLEFVSQRPTAECLVEHAQSNSVKKPCILSETNPTAKSIVVKRHRADHHWDTWGDDTRLIVLVRDPSEAVLRHHKDGNNINDCVSHYLHCLEFFNSFEGDKILIYYEDLLSRSEEELNKILDFVKLEKNNRYKELISNLEDHKKASLKSYGASQTYGDKNRPRHHSKMQPNKAKKVKNIIEQSPLKREYLSRYF